MGEGVRHIEVVGAAIVRDGTILCAQRGPAGTLGGFWEFPGGKIEQGETARQALEREIREELLCEVTVGDEVATTTHEYDFAIVTLTTFYCELVGGSPRLTEHSSARWLAVGDLHELEWAPADWPAVHRLQSELAS